MEALSLSRLDSLLILCSVVTSLSHLWILIVDLTTRDSAAGIGLATNRTALWAWIRLLSRHLNLDYLLHLEKNLLSSMGFRQLAPSPYARSIKYYWVRKSTLSSMALNMHCSYSHSRAGPALGSGEGFTSILGALTCRSITDYFVNLGVDDCVPILRYPYPSGLWRGSGSPTFTPWASGLVWTRSER